MNTAKNKCFSIVYDMFISTLLGTAHLLELYYIVIAPTIYVTVVIHTPDKVIQS